MADRRHPLRYTSAQLWAYWLTRPVTVVVGIVAAVVAGVVVVGVFVQPTATSDSTATGAASSITESMVVTTMPASGAGSLPAPSNLTVAWNEAESLCAAIWDGFEGFDVGVHRWAVEATRDGALIDATVNSTGFTPVALISDVPAGTVTVRVRLERGPDHSAWAEATCVASDRGERG